MFTRIAPQRAQHDDGSVVQIGGRYAVQYVQGNLMAEIEADFAALTGIYPETLIMHRMDGSPITTTDEERSAILAKILSGLSCLGVKYELCNGKL